MFKKKNFTLIELIVVIAVLGILASIVIPNISGMQEKAKVAQTVSNIRNIQTAVDMYFVENESYPTEVQPTEDNSQPIDYELLNFDYLREEPTDDLTYVVDFYGTVSVLDFEEPEIGGSNSPVKVNPPKIKANVDLSKDKIYPDTVLLFDYELESENVKVISEKWTVDGEPKDSAPNGTFSEGNHTVTLSVQYESLTRGIEENWTQESVFSFNVEKSIKIKEVIAGHYHTLALTEDGDLYAWGYNGYGQLADGTTVDNNTPTLIDFFTGIKIKQVSTGYYNTAVLTEDGQVYLWGKNDYGQLGDGTNINKATPFLMDSIPKVKQIDVGGYHLLALTEDGKVYSWGSNQYGQLGDGTNIHKNTPTLITSLSNIKQVECGEHHSLALTEDGKIYAWGYNGQGQLGDGSTTNKSTPVLITSLSNVKTIITGEYQSASITEDGKVYIWGRNTNGQLGDGTTAHKTKPTLISVPTNIKHIGFGELHGVATTEDGKVYTWGLNTSGQLGNGTTDPKTNPTLLTSLSHLKQISIGRYHNIALTEDGKIYSWGNNYNGQLGDSTNVHRNTPTSIQIK